EPPGAVRAAEGQAVSPSAHPTGPWQEGLPYAFEAVLERNLFVTLPASHASMPLSGCRASGAVWAPVRPAPTSAQSACHGPRGGVGYRAYPIVSHDLERLQHPLEPL